MAKSIRIRSQQSIIPFTSLSLSVFPAEVPALYGGEYDRHYQCTKAYRMA